MSPIGSASSITSLRLNGAAFLCQLQWGLNATCATLRLSAQQAAMRSAPIVVEIAANAIRLAVGKIHEGPEEVGKIGLQPRVDEKPRQGFDNGFERQCSRVGGGQGAGIGVVLEGSISEKGRLGEEMRGRRPLVVIRMRSVKGRSGDFVDHGVGTFAYGRADRGLTAILSHRRNAPHRKGRSNAEDASPRLTCAQGMPAEKRPGRGKKSAGSVAANEALVASSLLFQAGRRAAL